jgi:PKD repeat protein
MTAISALTATAQTAAAATGDVGHADQTYTGATNPPTADKPQSKLWFNDGLWWATMFDSASAAWHIFRLDRSAGSWVDTKTAVDNRPQTLSDALWDGSKLYIGSQYVTVSDDTAARPSQNQQARLYRYAYSSATKTYSLDAGFPSVISTSSSESLTIDKDTTGRVWATWTKVSGSSAAGYTGAVYVNSSADGATWGTPMVVPAAGGNTTVAPDDISALVAFGQSKVGVLWSNHLDDTVYWAVHKDGDPVGTWKGSVAVRGSKQADDHLNLKAIDADQAGRVVAAVKTSLDELPGSVPTDPQLNVLVFKPGTGSWSSTPFGTLADCHTRPLVMLDDANSEVHVFATAPTESGCAYSGKPGTIYEKTAPLDKPVFPAGRGMPVIRDVASPNMNNVTSTKQSVNSTSGLVVLASNHTTKQYWHADESLRTPSAPAAAFTATPTSGMAPLTVSFTDTSTNNPTSWAWSFGNGTTSTSRNPSATFSAAGTYTVTLRATNLGGTSTPATRTITVSAPPAAKIARAGTATKITTTAATSLAVARPTGTAAGNVLVSCVALNGGSVATAPSGWTRIAASTGITNPRVYGYYKVAGSAEPASYVWKFASSVTSSGGIARYTGATGLSGTARTASGAAATSGTVPGVTTATSNTMVVGCMGINTGSTAVTIGAPTGMSAAWDLGGKRQELDDAIQATAGTTGSKTWKFSSSREWAGWLAALR